MTPPGPLSNQVKPGISSVEASNTNSVAVSPTVTELSDAEIDGYLPQDRHFATRALHSGYTPSDNEYMAVVPPIVLSTTFEQLSPAVPKKYEYSRSGNPMRDVLEKCLASLDNGKYGLCFASGLGALTAIVSLFQSGDHIVCVDDVYGGTNRYLQKIAAKFNVTTTFFDFEDLTKLPNLIKPATKLVLLECPTNPLLKVIDIEAISAAVKAVNKETLILVDNTFLTSYFQKPLNLGADMSMYSLTKYMNGHADVIMGAVVMNDETLYENLKFMQYATGIVPSPFDCYLVDRSLKTLKLRMQEHMKNGLTVAKFLESHPMVEKVLYPGLKSHPNYDLAKKQWSGCSGMLAFYLKGDLEVCKRFLKKLKYFMTAESLGGYESLVEIPSLMTHASVPAEVRKELGITDNLIRVSVGLEAAEDLVEDFNQALNSIKE
ncbi:hypothetical protein V9T40_003441 [Parthenolecanium corni]|uniref:cystathionine gamma-lyase n=1 Tax=Parthenolecanium corni TaxID=536013 RepID=A0AAN9TR98_9HEMI